MNALRIDSGSSTQTLAAHCTSLSFERLPAEIITVAKQCFLDAIGVGIAGSNTEPARIATRVAIEDAPDGPCTIIGSHFRTTAMGAALANGTAIHALDYDDMSVPLCGHPTAPLLPALLALGEIRPTSGRDLLTAFVAGYEAECRVGVAVDPGHYARGFHATATVGTIGAAVGAGRMLGLNAAQMEMAIGIGATQAAGLKSMFGTMCKPLHAGRAAASGILSARLAGAGFTSAVDSISCDQGFASAETDTFAPEMLYTEFGSPWYLLENLFKFHAACYFTHGTIEAILEARQKLPDLASVEWIEVRVPNQHLSVCNIAVPSSGLEAKFSLRFAAAQTLVTGRSDEFCFSDEAVKDPSIAKISQLVEVTGDSTLGTYDTIVTIQARSGMFRIEKNTKRPSWVLEPKEQSRALQDKFHALVDPILGESRASALSELTLNLEEVATVDKLARRAI